MRKLPCVPMCETHLGYVYKEAELIARKLRHPKCEFHHYAQAAAMHAREARN